MQGLGRLYDFSAGATPVDLVTAGATGKRVSLRDCEGVAMVAFIGAAASGTEALTLTVKQHTASTAGTSATLSGADSSIRVHIKSRAGLLGTEVWSAVSNPTSGVITVAGADRDKEQIIVVELDAVTLSDGYNYASLDASDPGIVSRLGAILYVQRDLKVQRKPSNLRASLN